MHPDEARGEEQQNPPRVLDAESGTYGVEGSPAILWLDTSFAQEWYEDALAEARADDTFQHCRREIVFAVCAVESYLFEWVRDEVFRRDFTALNTYLLLDPHEEIQGREQKRIEGMWIKGIQDRWKEVLKDLHEHRLIPKYPNMRTRVWQDFVVLVNYRNGLMHASVSQPEPDELPADLLRLSARDREKLKPVPSRSDRKTMDPGWATGIVARLITHLHSEIGTQPPAWLIEP